VPARNTVLLTGNLTTPKITSIVTLAGITVESFTVFPGV
jgi:hypothetical protein